MTRSVDEGAGWRDRFPASGVVSILVQRIDQKRQLAEQRDIDRLIPLMRRRAWASSLDLTGVPMDILRRVEDWIQAGYDALRQNPPDWSYVSRALCQARKELTG